MKEPRGTRASPTETIQGCATGGRSPGSPGGRLPVEATCSLRQITPFDCQAGVYQPIIFPTKLLQNGGKVQWGGGRPGNQVNPFQGFNSWGSPRKVPKTTGGGGERQFYYAAFKKEGKEGGRGKKRNNDSFGKEGGGGERKPSVEIAPEDFTEV